MSEGNYGLHVTKSAISMSSFQSDAATFYSAAGWHEMDTRTATPGLNDDSRSKSRTGLRSEDVIIESGEDHTDDLEMTMSTTKTNTEITAPIPRIHTEEVAITNNDAPANSSPSRTRSRTASGSSTEVATSSTTSPPLIGRKPEDKKLESVKMQRIDSGFEEGLRRRSTSRSSRQSSNKSKKAMSRPIARRMAKSSPGYLSSDNSVPVSRSLQYTYYQFPSIVDLNPEPAQPPPSTMHYWTSEETRRLEYAAIDAASRGLRGFLVRLVPDCILPDSYKRTRFHNEDSDSDAGSVRRYRLTLPEEKCKSTPKRRFKLFRRWTTYAN